MLKFCLVITFIQCPMRLFIICNLNIPSIWKLIPQISLRLTWIDSVQVGRDVGKSLRKGPGMLVVGRVDQ